MKNTYPLSSSLHVVRKLGGIDAVAALVERHRSRVNQLLIEGKPIPASWQHRLMDKAREGLIDLAPEDFFTVPPQETSAATEAA